MSMTGTATPSWFLSDLPNKPQYGIANPDMRKKERIQQILAIFREKMPNPVTELEYGNVFQLLVAVMLSAQCTDKRVNMVTPELFRRFPSARQLAEAGVDEVLAYVSSISYPNAKAKHLVEMARRLVESHHGEVPQTMDDLLALPGVGRKTANVILSVAFGQMSMAVDTHVFRVSHRLGLVKKSAATPLHVERELMANIPQSDIPYAHHWLLLHGRYVCTSRHPHCDKCFLNHLCPSASKTNDDD